MNLVITTDSALPNGTVGTSYSQTLRAAGASSLTWTRTSGSLPAGLTLNADGTITGTPTASGTSDFTVQAGAGNNITATKAFRITVDPAQAINITTTSLPSGKVGTSYTATLASSTSGVTWSVSAGSLPAGLSLNASTGTISGTPTSAGTSTFTVRAVKGASSGTRQLSITVAQADAINITTTSLPSGKVGTSYTATLASGTSGVTWSVSSGSLPAGLSLNASTGTISGTPTSAGTYTFTVRAMKGASSGTRQLSITVSPADTASTTITITTASLPSGTVGTSYSAQLASSVSNASWSVSAGNLPAGLALSTSGRISGTPTAQGTFSFTVRAASGNASGTRALSITVNAASLTITTTSLPSGTVGEAYRQTLQASVSGVTWSVSSGSLPAGLSLESTTGIISGTLSQAGSYTFTVQARSAYANATKTFTVNVTNADGTTGNAGSSSGGGGCNSGLGIFGAIIFYLPGVVCILRRK